MPQLRIDIFNRLCRALAASFFSRGDAEAIAISLKMDMGEVGFDVKAINTFTSILSIAERDNLVEQLLIDALSKKSGNQELIALRKEIEQNGYIQPGGFDITYEHCQKEKPVKVAIVYEPPFQEPVRKLQNHMAVYRKNGWLDVYDWMKTNDGLKCQIALMLMTPELMASDRPYFQWAVEARQSGMRVISVLVTPCDWGRIIAFAGRVPLPRDGSFLSQGSDGNYMEVAKGVLQLANSMQEKSNS